MDLQNRIAMFLDGSPHAVVGASEDRNKYGNKVLRAFLQHGRSAIPINPHSTAIEGLSVFRSLEELPQKVHGISIVTPPHVTEQVVAAAVALGIEHIWMQPGAESPAAIEAATVGGANVIAGGPCLLVALRFREEAYRPPELRLRRGARRRSSPRQPRCR